MMDPGGTIPDPLSYWATPRCLFVTPAYEETFPDIQTHAHTKIFMSCWQSIAENKQNITWTSWPFGSSNLETLTTSPWIQICSSSYNYVKSLRGFLLAPRANYLDFRWCHHKVPLESPDVDFFVKNAQRFNHTIKNTVTRRVEYKPKCFFV